MAPQIGVLSGTFVYRDIEGLRALGAEVRVFSMRRPAQEVTSPEAEGFIRETDYLYDRGPLATLAAAARRCARHPGRFFRVFGLALRDAARAKAPSPAERPKLVWHFFAGCLLAEGLEAFGAHHVHCNFAHAPTTITMYAALLAGVPYSFLCHAHDIFVNGAALREKTARAAFGMCSSGYNVRFLVERQGCDPGKLHVMRTGVDLNRFTMRPEKPFSEPFRLLSIGRLVDKKGFDTLLEAVALLAREGRHVRATLIGGGPLEEALRGQVRNLGLGDKVELTGPLPQETVREHFAGADAFVLACKEAKNRDMDGTPIVLIEAMSLGVPVVSTTVSGNPELIENGVSGFLVAPEDPAALARAVGRLMDDPAAAAAQARAARAKIEHEFDLEGNIARLLEHIRAAQAVAEH